VKKWAAMYENVCGSRRLLEGNIMTHAPFVAEIARLVKAGDSLLEVGSGTGVLAWPIAQSGVAVTSLDNDPEVLWMALLNCLTLGANIELKEGDAFAIPFPDNSFTVAYSHGLLEHFSDDDIHKLIAEQFRVAPIVVVGVPLVGNKGIALGNERWMTVSEWENILGGYPASNAFGYLNETMLCVTMVRNGQDKS